MDNWGEVRTAFQVALHGTVSGAAEALGVHHATVIRHIDALEAQLGAKLFQRHARGYTPTEAGEDLLRVAQATEDQFNQLQGRIKGRGEGVSGELVVTSLVGISILIGANASLTSIGTTTIDVVSDQTWRGLGVVIAVIIAVPYILETAMDRLRPYSDEEE